MKLAVASGAFLVAFVGSPAGTNAGVGKCADERVAAVDLTISPAIAREHQPTLLTFRIDAICPAPVSWRIEVGSRTIASGTQEAQPAPGGVVTIAATWTPVSGGDHVIRGIVDPDNLLGESEGARKNNVVARSVHVVAAAQPITAADSPPKNRSNERR